MITLRTLGAIGLTTEAGHSVDGLLRQPKRLAVLAHLACPRPGTWHRRDTLMAMFWPEVDDRKARGALRNALYVIRQQVGAEVIRTRGDDEVSLDPNVLRCDAGEFRDRLEADRVEDALALWQGDFLPGLFIADAAEFEHWLDGERRRLREAGATVLARASLARETAGDLSGAASLQARLVDLDPANEGATRRLITVLDRLGQRSKAEAAFERLRTALRGEYEAEPSAETIRWMADLRARPAPVAPSRDDGVAAPAPPREQPPAAERPLPFARPRPWPWWAAAAAVLLVPLALWFRPARTAGSVPGTIVVLPMENRTGNPAYADIATALSDDIAERLSTLPAVTIRSNPRHDWSQRVRDSLDLLATRLGAAAALRGVLSLVGDSLRAEWEVVRLPSGTRRALAPVQFTVPGLRDAASRLAAAAAGAVFRVPLPEVPRQAERTPDPEAYGLTMLGWQQLLGAGERPEAGELFRRATELDPLYARAWSGLSSFWAAATASGSVPFEDGFERAEAAAQRAIALDSLEGSAWANLGILHALRERSLAAGESYFRRAIAAEPGNPEIYMVQAAALRHAHQWDELVDVIRIARRLDPLSALYASSEANTAMCAGRPADALPLFRTVIELDPDSRSGHLGVARALAQLGQWDQAIAQLGAMAVARGDSTMAAAAATARGERGYWGLKHREGQPLLEARQAAARSGWVSPWLLGAAEIGAGAVESGMARLEAEVAAGSRMAYKLPCNPEIDQIRSTPGYRRLLERAGHLSVEPGPR